MRKLVLVSVVVGSLLAASTAHATIPSALGVTCTVAADNVRECGSTSPRSTSPSWDGTPIDVNIAFPPDPGSGDGNYPLIIVGHGYGGSKIGFGASGSSSGLRQFTSRGYAVFSMTDRGFHESCGSAASVTAGGSACSNGYIHLMDDRYEIRDAQFFAGELADEGVVDGQRVGAIGGSYGGGLSLQLATLKDRVMMPDGSLVPWTSPVHGIPMRIAAAAPNIPWSDLAYSLTPNGHKLDYVADPAYTGRMGIEKESFNNGLYATVNPLGAGLYCGEPPYPSPCTDFGADVTSWKTRIEQGEPYDGDPTSQAVLDEIKAHHSAYYIDHSEPPAPLLISNGFSDDLFPADEAIGYYNRIRSQYPDAPISLFFGDFGHMRALNKADVSSALNAAAVAWLDFYVKGTGSQPFQGATAYTLTCPSSAPSGGPYQAGSWAGLSHGVVRFRDSGSKTISATGGSPSVDATFDPVQNGAGGNACQTAPGDDLERRRDLQASRGRRKRLHASRLADARGENRKPGSQLRDRGTAPGCRRQHGDARRTAALPASGRYLTPGVRAASQWTPLRARPRREAGAAAEGCRRDAAQQLRPPRERAGRHHGLEPRPAAARVRWPRCGRRPGCRSAAVAASLRDGDRSGVLLGVLPARLPGERQDQDQGQEEEDEGQGAGRLRTRLEPMPGQGEAAGLGQGERQLRQKKKKKGGSLGKGSATIAGGQSAMVAVKLTKHGRKAVSKGGSVRVEITTVDATGNTVQTTKVKLGKNKKGKKKHKK